MVGYVTVGASDFDKSIGFYLGLLGPLGASRLMDFDGFALIGNTPDDACVAVVRPFDGKPPTVGNGIMVALRVETPEEVDGLYERALELGGSDEGPPGDRGGIFYAAYFRDIDGNKLNAFCMGS